MSVRMPSFRALTAVRCLAEVSVRALRKFLPSPSRRATVCLTLAVAVAGCTSVSDPAGSGAGATVSAVGGSTSGGNTGIPGAGGVASGGQVGTPCNVAPVPIQRLTKLEYNNVVRDLFGVQKDYAAAFSDDAEGPAGFTSEGIAQNLALSQVNDYL